MTTPDNSPNERGMRNEERITAMLRDALTRMIPNASRPPGLTCCADGVGIGFARCRDGFGQLAAILKAIECQAAHASDVGRLAGAGLYIARDLEDLADRWCGEVATSTATGD